MLARTVQVEPTPAYLDMESLGGANAAKQMFAAFP